MPFPAIAAGLALGKGALLGAASSLAGGIFRGAATRRYNREERARQDSQLQRMMRDAGLAGIHPVAALGFQGANYGSPVGVPPDTGSAIAEAGGRLSDFVLAQQDYQIALQQLELEGKRLDNELRYQQLAEAQSRTFLQALRQEAPVAVVGDTTVLDTEGDVILPRGQMTAQEGEDLFGEFGDWVIGVPNFLRALQDVGIERQVYPGHRPGRMAGQFSFALPPGFGFGPPTGGYVGEDYVGH